ncbi:MAG: lipopeptide [Proteobacteria bacterium]|nr:MAG: lipopeptide [Pseudomonadota bacterium]QKK10950.1 MAG: lipopeptide [Pseudomonadota bacterium]
MPRPAFALFALLLATLLALSACGQTGALYLPDDQSETVQRDKKQPE